MNKHKAKSILRVNRQKVRTHGGVADGYEYVQPCPAWNLINALGSQAYHSSLDDWRLFWYWMQSWTECLSRPQTWSIKGPGNKFIGRRLSFVMELVSCSWS